MVNRFIFLFLIISSCLFSGEFNASVNRNQVRLGENFVLNLTLKEASTQAAPSIDALKQDFSIYSQQQSFNTVIINGKFNATTHWKINLIPVKEGSFTIPSISLETSEGILTTQPIPIQVTKGNANNQADKQEILLSTNVSQVNPYKNEPFIYTLQIISASDLSNVQLEKLAVEEAIIENYREPKVKQEVKEGMRVNVAEIQYLITPLKAGTLKIPSIKVQGATPVKRKSVRRSFFDDEMDLFSMLQGFDQLQPFVLVTEEIAIEVQPPMAEVNPWLPAQSLKIEQAENPLESLRVGEPFTLRFKILAEGIKADQIPSIKDQLVDHLSFKVYADQPELKNEDTQDKIKSTREEQYTFIPQKAGNLELPAISIAWWDTVNKQKKIAYLPPKTVSILPALQQASESFNQPDSPSEPLAATPAIQRDPLLYGLVTGLALLLLGALIWVIVLQKKISQSREKPIKQKVKEKATIQPQAKKIEDKENKKDKNEKLPDLNPT